MAFFNSPNVNGGIPQGARSLISFLKGNAIFLPRHFLTYKSLQKIMSKGATHAYRYDSRFTMRRRPKEGVIIIEYPEQCEDPVAPVATMEVGYPLVCFLLPVNQRPHLRVNGSSAIKIIALLTFSYVEYFSSNLSPHFLEKNFDWKPTSIITL